MKQKMHLQALLLLQAALTDELNNGSCGYGPLQHQWPFLSGAVFSSSNPAMQGLPMNGCGTCWEVQCVDSAENQVCHLCKIGC